MKRKLSLTVVLSFILLVFNFSASAYTIEDWINVGGSNCTVTESGSTVVVEGTGYYPNANTGVIYAKEIDVSDVSIEFEINEICGKENDGFDSWISLGIFTKKAYMDITNPAKTEGIVLLIRPNNTGGARVQYMSLIEGQSFGSKGNGTVAEFDEGNTYTLAFKSDDTAGYALYINNEKIMHLGAAADLNFLNDVFDTGKGYLALSMSDNQDTNMKITITKLNGKTAIGGESTSESATSETVSEIVSQSEETSQIVSSQDESEEISEEISEEVSKEVSEVASESIASETVSEVFSEDGAESVEDETSSFDASKLVFPAAIVLVVIIAAVYYFRNKAKSNNGNTEK